MKVGSLLPIAWGLVGLGAIAWSADAEVLRPRVPVDQIESARAVTNPFPVTPEMREKGKALFGKGLLPCLPRE